MRRILVTGANKGIGLAITTAILERDTDTSVLLGSRNLERGRAARALILEDHPQWALRLEVLELDVSSNASVEQAAGILKTRFKTIYCHFAARLAMTKRGFWMHAC